MQLGFDFKSFLNTVGDVKEFEREKKKFDAIDSLPPLFKEASEGSPRTVYCPLCQTYFQESDYLRSVIADNGTLWIANNITHYRHNHIESWNKCWGYGGGRYRSGWFGDYDNEKRKVNERAKRQLIRKAGGYMRAKFITSKHFEGLEHNDPETLQLARATVG